MSTFEYVFGLISIMSSLALTQLVSGVVRIIREDRSGTLDAASWLWVWAAFATVVGNWGTFWGSRMLEDWTTPFVLGNLGLMIAQYAWCEFIFPREGVEPTFRDRRRVVATVLVMIAIAVTMNVASASFYADWWRDTVLSLVLAAIMLPLMFVRNRWVQLGGAALLAIESTFFLSAATAIVAA